MTTTEALLPESPDRQGRADFLPFRISGELQGFPIPLDAVVETRTEPPRNLPDLSKVRFLPEDQSNIGYLPPDPVKASEHAVSARKLMAENDQQYKDRVWGGGQAPFKSSEINRRGYDPREMRDLREGAAQLRQAIEDRIARSREATVSLEARPLDTTPMNHAQK